MPTIPELLRADEGRVQTRPLTLLVRGEGCWFDVWAGDLWLATAPTREAALSHALGSVETLGAELRGLLGEED